MTQLDHPSAHAVLREIVTGIRVDPARVEQVLAHVSTCEQCAEIFDLQRTAACEEVEDDLADAAGVLREGGDLASSHPAVARHVADCTRCASLVADLMREIDEPIPMTQPPVDTNDLFERAYVRRLSEAKETVVRARAAAGLGSLEHVGVETLGALAEAAGEDVDERVRTAALMALDRLDTQVSIPQRLIEEWASAPAKAASFIAGVLERFARGPIPSVMWLTARKRPFGRTLAVTGTAGIKGSLNEEGRDIWLRLGRLPAYLEHTRPVVALPLALQEDAPAIDWSGERPGLVQAPSPITGGAFEVLLASGVPGRSEAVFRNMYLLAPELHSHG